MHEQVEALSTGKYFVQLDLANGYLQLPLTKDAQEKTGFVTPDDTGQFTHMPFGLAGVLGEFTRLMYKVLGKLRNTVVKNYLDDWVVDATNWTKMLKRLREVLMRLRFANLTLKPAKCSLGAKYMEFLSFVIGGGTICPGDAKTRAVQEFPKPNNVHEQEAFDKLKNVLVSKPVMAMFNQNGFSTKVHMNASSVGIGAMLLQRSKDGEAQRLVYCISKKLTEAETKYHSGKLE
ncbi:hypothetical protein QTP88_014843 [Uroleucon formosanum]